jgi:hypothetical protein
MKQQLLMLRAAAITGGGSLTIPVWYMVRLGLSLVVVLVDQLLPTIDFYNRTKYN